MNIYKLTDGEGVVTIISADTFKVEGNYVVFYVVIPVSPIECTKEDGPIYLCSNAVTVGLVNE